MSRPDRSAQRDADRTRREVPRHRAGRPPGRQEVDLVDAIESGIETVETAHPHAEVSATLPESLRIEADPRIDPAVYELLENAVVHNDCPEPTVEVTASDRGRGIVITDDSPVRAPV